MGWDRVRKYTRTWIADSENAQAATRRIEITAFVSPYSNVETTLSRTDISRGNGKSRKVSLAAGGISDQTSAPFNVNLADFKQVPTAVPFVPAIVTSTSTATSGVKSVGYTHLGSLYRRESLGNEATPTLLEWTQYSYDILGRVTSSDASRTGVTEYDYSPDELTTTVTSPLPTNQHTARPRTITTLDVFGRTLSRNATDDSPAASSQTTTWLYTASGQVKTERGALTYPVDNTYDRQGRMVSMTTYKTGTPADPTGPAVTLWAYDNHGHQASKTYEAFDQDGNGTNEPEGVVRYAYTSGDRLARRTWARGEITNYIYHPSTGDLLYTDYGTNTDTRDLAYTYDRLGRVTKVTEGTLSGSPSYTVTNLTGNGTVSTLVYTAFAPQNQQPPTPWWMTTTPPLNYTQSPLGLSGGSYTVTSAPYYYMGVPSGYYIWTFTFTFTNSGGYTGTAPIEISMDVFSESGETHDYLYTNAALAAGLPNVSRLTQEKITGRTADPIYLNRSHWITNDAGSRIGQSAGYNAQIGPDPENDLDTQLEVHYDWGVNGRLKQLDAKYPDSYGSGTPAKSQWRAAYEFGNAEDGNLLTRLLRQRVDGAGAEDWVDSVYAYEEGRDNLLSVTNRTLVTASHSYWELQPPPAAPFTTSVHTYTTNHLGQRTQQNQALNAYFWGMPGNVRDADRNYSYNERGEVAVATTANANFINPQGENEQFVYDQIGNRQWHSRGEAAPTSVPSDSTAAPSGASTYTASKANTYNAVNGADGGAVPGVQKYDADANLIDDGTFTYVWDSENRLISLAPKVAQPYDYRFTFRYDWLSRRRERTSEYYNSITWTNSELSKFVYDGWNPILQVRSYGAGTPLLNQFIWGTDLSGSLQGAGGVGGLLFVHQQFDDMALMEDGTSLYTYDGNGNVSEVIGGTGYSDELGMDFAGRTLGQFRYDAFGRTLLNYEGDLGAGNVDPSVITVPFTFSTKWQDQTSAFHYIWQFNSSDEQWEGIQNPRCRTLHYYGYRYLSVDTGRWLGRDPIEERGGKNLFGMVENNSVNRLDVLGCWDWFPPKITNVVWKATSEICPQGTIKKFIQRVTNAPNPWGVSPKDPFWDIVEDEDSKQNIPPFYSQYPFFEDSPYGPYPSQADFEVCMACVCKEGPDKGKIKKFGPCYQWRSAGHDNGDGLPLGSQLDQDKHGSPIPGKEASKPFIDQLMRDYPGLLLGGRPYHERFYIRGGILGKLDRQRRKK